MRKDPKDRVVFKVMAVSLLVFCMMSGDIQANNNIPSFLNNKVLTVENEEKIAFAPPPEAMERLRLYIEEQVEKNKKLQEEMGEQDQTLDEDSEELMTDQIEEKSLEGEEVEMDETSESEEKIAFFLPPEAEEQIRLYMEEQIEKNKKLQEQMGEQDQTLDENTEELMTDQTEEESSDGEEVEMDESGH